MMLPRIVGSNPRHWNLEMSLGGQLMKIFFPALYPISYVLVQVQGFNLNNYSCYIIHLGRIRDSML